MFKKFVEQLTNANSAEEILNILYNKDGVDMMFQREKISWKDHELLFALAGKLEKAYH